jgi:membrane protein implicated in regulation of membrane protease activity
MTPDQPSVFQAVAETVARASELIRLEIRLAKAELAEKSVHLKAGVGTILVGAVIFTVGLFLFAQGLVVLLIGLGLSPLAATLIVAALFAGGGLALIAGGRKELDAGTLTPQRTLDDLERDRVLVKEKMS